MEERLTIVDQYIAREYDPFLKRALISLRDFKIKDIPYNPLSIRYEWDKFILVKFNIQSILFDIKFGRYKNKYDIICITEEKGYKEYLCYEQNIKEDEIIVIEQLFQLIKDRIEAIEEILTFDDCCKDFFEY